MNLYGLSALEGLAQGAETGLKFGLKYHQTEQALALARRKQVVDMGDDPNSDFWSMIRQHHPHLLTPAPSQTPTQPQAPTAPPTPVSPVQAPAPTAVPSVPVPNLTQPSALALASPKRVPPFG